MCLYRYIEWFVIYFVAPYRKGNLSVANSFYGVMSICVALESKVISHFGPPAFDAVQPVK